MTFPRLQVEQPIDGGLAIPYATAQLAPGADSGTENFSNRNGYTGQFGQTAPDPSTVRYGKKGSRPCRVGRTVELPFLQRTLPALLTGTGGSGNEFHPFALGALWPLESATSPVVLLGLASKAEGIGFPSLGGRCLGFGVFTAMIRVEKKCPEAGIKIRQRERRLSAHSATSRSIAIIRKRTSR